MQRIGTLVVLGLLAAIGALWAFDRSTPSATTTEQRRDAAEPSTDALLNETRPRPPSLAATSDGGRAVASAHRGRGSIVGVVRRDGKPQSAAVELSFLEAVVGANARPGTTEYLHRLLEPPERVGPPIATTRAGADGRYAIEGLGAGVYRVGVSTDDGSRGLTTATLEVEGARAVADVAIAAAGESLTGYVVYADSSPFRGALFIESVNKRESIWALSHRDEVAVDSDGHFNARAIAAGTVVLTALQRGDLYARSAAVPIPQAGDLRFVVDHGAVLRHGRVVAAEDGQPVAGAQVLGGATTKEGEMTLASTTTAPDGSFMLSVAKGGGGLRAIATGYAPLRKDLQSLGEGEIEFRLVRGGRIEGRITSETDRSPLAGLTVRTVDASRDPARALFAPSPTTTDADGRYAFVDLVPAELTLIVEGNGWVPKGVAEVRDLRATPFTVVVEAGKTTTFDMEAVRAATAKGLVLDADGKPVAGAVVRAAGRESANSFWWAGIKENLADCASATAADGTFETNGLVGGVSYVFTATMPDESTATSDLVRADDAAPVRVEIRAQPLRRLVVTVLDDVSGAPIAKSSVRASSAERVAVGVRQDVSVRTNDDGVVTVKVRGLWAMKLDVSADGYLPSDERRVEMDATTATVRLSKGHVLSGRVVTADGRPASGASVTAQESEGVRGDPGMSGRHVEADGNFAFTFATPGSRTIRAMLSVGGVDLAAAAVGVADGEPVTLRLEARGTAKPLAGSLVVRVLDPDGKSVPRARVAMEGRNREADAAAGWAEFMPKEKEDVWVYVYRARNSDDQPLPLGPARYGPVAPSTNEIVVSLPREERIDGVVVGPDGKAVHGVGVTCTWTSIPDGHDWNFADVSTGGDGTFSIGGLGRDECELDFDVPARFAAPAHVLAKGGTRGLVVRLRSGVSASIKVVDGSGKRVQGVTVSLRGDGPYQSVETSSDGIAMLSRLDPTANYSLEVSDFDDRFVSRTIESWKLADTTVTLETEVVLRGVVRDPMGKPLAGVDVLATAHDDENGFVRSKRTNADGTFSIAGFSQGEVHLSARVHGTFGGDSSETVVAADAQEIVLTLDPGVETTVHVDNWPSGADGSGFATMFEEGARTPTYSIANVLVDGSARFHGIDAAKSYVLWVSPVGEGLSLYRPHVRVGGGPMHVSLTPGKAIHGHLVVPLGSTVRNLLAARFDNHLTVLGTAHDDGTFEILGLPDGDWSVQVTATRGPERFHAEATATAGGSLDLEPKAK